MTEELVELRFAEHRDRILRRESVDASQAPIVMDVSRAGHRPILRFDRARRQDIPDGPTLVTVDGEEFLFDFKKIAVNVARRDGDVANVLPEVLRRLLGPSTGQPGIRHRVHLVRAEEGWRIEPARTSGEVIGAANVIPLQRIPYFADVQVACGALDEAAQQSDRVEPMGVQSSTPLDPRRHFVVRAMGDSMNGGDAPIADGDLVLCEWTPNATEESIQGRATLLVGHDAADSSFAVLKVPVKTKDGWQLTSWNSAVAPQAIPSTTRLQAVARVLRVVEDPVGLVLYGAYDRDAIAGAFGDKNNPSWKVGHRDIDVAGTHHTVLMVTLRKAEQTKPEHRYADSFVSPQEFLWESQASTAADSLKGRRIRGVDGEPRTVHLFVQYESHQKFTYLGPVRYLDHEGERPMRVRWELRQPLPEALWKMWG